MTNSHKPGVHKSGRAYRSGRARANSWALFSRKPCRVGRGHRDAVRVFKKLLSRDSCVHVFQKSGVGLSHLAQTHYDLERTRPTASMRDPRLGTTLLRVVRIIRSGCDMRYSARSGTVDWQGDRLMSNVNMQCWARGGTSRAIYSTFSGVPFGRVTNHCPCH